jgi:hypothetical protein
VSGEADVLDADTAVTTTGFDIGCQACGMAPFHVRAGMLEVLVQAHQLPVLLAVHICYRGRPQTWVCRQPRPLTR